jgi:hypothetical protein
MMQRLSTYATRPRPAAEIDTTIRRARDEDAYALGRLAQLDSGLYDGGPALLAESGGEVLAAVPLGGGGRSFADPFRRTSEIVSLLELRATQLEGLTPARPPRLRRLLRAARRPRRYRAHA